ncbi:MAG: hypothetical protein JWP74_2445 [Marmoricola sp.]|nr:hypothetical protein [Marmoricola sp.]
MTASWLAALEGEASRVLPPEVYEYFRQGSGASTSADEAAAAWQRYRLVPRIFADVRDVDLATSMLGVSYAAPLGIAPTTLQRAAHREGEVAMATAAAAAHCPMVLSSNAAATFDEVAATGVGWWLQAYLPQERSLALPMLEAAVGAGCRAVVLTADTPVVAAKADGGRPSVLGQVPRRWLRTNLGDAADAPKAQDLGPADVTWLRDVTGLPVVVKGVLRRDDARVCVEAGAAAVWVSNHGGRQLDRSVSTASRLAGVVEAVSGSCEVYVDGGVRDGVGVLTGLALGADAVFLGRLPLWALAVAGRTGVERMFSDLGSELIEAMRIAGCAVPGSARTVVGAEFE